MGDIVPFIARVRDSGDWSPAERARLEEFGERLAASGAEIEVIFGTTDEGDPWCVVKDENEEILVHVARIGGRFVVHSAIEDTIAEDSNLYEALRDRLADAVEIPTAQVLPFALPREAQTFIALLVATAFFYETSGIDIGLEPAGAAMQLEPEPEPGPPSTVAEDGQIQDRDIAIQGAVFAETVIPDLITRQLASMIQEEALGDRMPPRVSAQDQPQVMPVETAARQTATVMLARSEAAAGERLGGDQAGERIMGGAGADSLRGSALDTLQGGAGNDRLELAGATAIGGEGADTFVIINPTTYGRADTLLGVIEDFSAEDGDRVTTEGGVEVSLTPPTLLPGDEGETDKTTPPSDVWTRVEVDLNGDGVVDGYILVRRAGSPAEGEDEKDEPAPSGEDAWEPLPLAGQTLAGAADPWAA